MAEKTAETAQAAEQTSSEKLHEGMRIANEALKEMGGEAKEAALDKYQHLRQYVAESGVADKVVQARDYTCERAREVGVKVDESVHDKPYLYIGVASGVAAAVGLTFGLLIGRLSKE